MSRSKHTDPRRIRGARRIQNPFEPRRSNDQSTFRRTQRQLKESGISPINSESQDRLSVRPSMPRIVVNRPRRGFLHPAQKSDILTALELLGKEYCYGIDAIKLLQRPGFIQQPVTQWCFARLQIPGVIVLYEVPESPWIVAGQVAQKAEDRLERAGALLEYSAITDQTLIHWRTSDLKHFMLFDVLAHEIGHHFKQQHTGKRTDQIARTADHEYSADLFAIRCKSLLINSQEDRHDRN